MEWFEEALEILVAQIEGKGKVSGVEFLAEYFTTYHPKEFLDYNDGESEDESADLYANATVDHFQQWLIVNHQHKVGVGNRYRWSKPIPDSTKASSDKIEQPIVLDELVLNEDEKKVASKSFANLSEHDIEHLDSIYEKALGAGDEILIADFAHRVAIAHDARDDRSILTADKWVNCADKALSGKHTHYAKAAYIYAVNLKHNLSGLHYEKAYQVVPRTERDKGTLRYVREARLQFQSDGNQEKASELYVYENKLQLALSTRYKNLGRRLFALISKSGESPLYVFITALIVIVFCAFLYSHNGVYASDNFFSELGLSNEEISDINSIASNETVGCLNALKISLYYSIVTFTTLGYGDFSPSSTLVRTISSIEAALGLLLTSLFMVCAVRKYAR